MARMIKLYKNQSVSLIVTTRFKDGSTSDRTLSIGDVVEGLRYVSNEEIISVTGRVASFKYAMSVTTKVDTSAPADYFANDVKIESVVIDCSAQYESNLVTIPVMEIIEDEGVVDVVKVDSAAYPKVTMKMQYTDGSLVDQDIEIGDVLTDFFAMSGVPKTGDITGDYRIAAFIYKNVVSTPSITGLYLTPLDGGTTIAVPFENIISFVEADAAYVTAEDSLIEITKALAASETGEVYAQLSNDVTIPPREDGKITTTQVGTGKTLNLDLNGHSINTSAYAFMVNGEGAVLNISDSTGKGAIKCGIADKTYPAVYVANGGVCNMYSGTIDTTNIELAEGESNWEYGVSVFGPSEFNMYGGTIKTASASSIATTNQTSEGVGAQFTISGDSVLETADCDAIYLPDQRSVTLKDNAKVIGGMTMRMGHLTVQDNAQIIGHPNNNNAEGLGFQVTFSGVCKNEAALTCLTGIYDSTAGNDLEVIVKDNAKIIGKINRAIDVCKIDTKYDQNATITIANAGNLAGVDGKLIKVYENEELREIATAAGRTLAAKSKETNLTIKVGKETLVPNVGEPLGEWP